MKTADRAVAFIALRHKVITARIPMRILPEDRNFGPDVMGRVQSAFPQDMRGHGRGRRLAVHSSDQDSVFIPHDRGQSFCSSRYPLGGAAGREQDWVFLLNGRGVNDQLGLLCILCAMLMEKS